MKYTPKEELEKTLSRLHKRLGRPVHIADFKGELGIKTKRESAKRSSTETDLIVRNLTFLFRMGRIAKSEKLARVEDYPVSPTPKIRERPLRTSASMSR